MSGKAVAAADEVGAECLCGRLHASCCCQPRTSRSTPAARRHDFVHLQQHTLSNMPTPSHHAVAMRSIATNHQLADKRHRGRCCQVLNEMAPRPPHPEWPKLTVAGKQDNTRRMRAVTWQGKHKASHQRIPLITGAGQQSCSNIAAHVERLPGAHSTHCCCFEPHSVCTTARNPTRLL